jgi:ubiquitin carboxyl-terminal hydrolase 36/42
LHNPGNDCFMNAVLQAFVHTAQVVRFLFSHNQPNNCSSMCLMCGLRTHAIRAVTGSGPQTSNWLNKHLRRIFPSHYEGHQEDAHELLTLLLGALDPLPPKQPNGMPKLPNRTSTPIEQIFGGTLRNQVKCQVCCTVHTNYERIREINLGLRLRIQEGNTSMSKLISDFFQPEQIKDFSCKKCNRKVSAMRSTCILRAPLVLIVQLKRFTTFGGKIKLPVTSEEQINLAPYHHSREETGYRLNGVIEHIGNGVNSGHYVAAMRGFDEQSWYFFDDDVKGKVSLQRVQAMLPYIVFYTRMRKNGPSPAVNGNQTNGSALGKRPASILDNLTPKTTQSSYSSTSYFTINNYKKARIS